MKENHSYLGGIRFKSIEDTMRDFASHGLHPVNAERDAGGAGTGSERKKEDISSAVSGCVRICSADPESERTNNESSVCYFRIDTRDPERVRSGVTDAGIFSRGADFLDSMELPLMKDPLEKWQHRKLDGIWSLIMERPDENITTGIPHEEYSSPFSDEYIERLNSGVVFIMRLDESRVDTRITKSISSDSVVLDYKTHRGFRPAEIIAVLVPEKLYVLCQRMFEGSSIRVVPVSTRKEPIFGKIIGKAEGPDFVEKLNELKRAGMLPEIYAAHVVRLPTKQDVMKHPGLRARIAVAEFRETYQLKAEHDQHTLLRRIAGYGCYEDLAHFLKTERVDINHQSSTGETALHLALKEKNPHILKIKLLLKKGASPTIKDNASVTAAILAMRHSLNLAEIESGVWETKREEKLRAAAMGEIHRMFAGLGR